MYFKEVFHDDVAKVINYTQSYLFVMMFKGPLIVVHIIHEFELSGQI